MDSNQLRIKRSVFRLPGYRGSTVCILLHHFIQEPQHPHLLSFVGVLDPASCGHWGADVAKFLGAPKVLHKFSTALGSAPLTSVLFNCNRGCAHCGRTEHSASGNLPTRGQDSLVNLLGCGYSIHCKPILLNHISPNLFGKRKWIKIHVCVNLLCPVPSGGPGACASASHPLPRPTLTSWKAKVSSAFLNFSEQIEDLGNCWFYSSFMSAFVA